MAKQDSFTADEWTLVRLAPSLVSGGMAAADPSGIFASIREAAANASKEGGFLGFGGVRVSDKEQAFMSEVKRAIALA